MLSIVIPYYKITFFDQTLKSLATQTDKRFKVYIGDDASPEPPIDLLENYKGNLTLYIIVLKIILEECHLLNNGCVVLPCRILRNG